MNIIKKKGKGKEKIYEFLSKEYRVHINTIRKVIKRGKNKDFSLHDSTRKNRKTKNWRRYLNKEKKILRRVFRQENIVKYEMKMPGELAHIDVHKLKNIKGQNPKKKEIFSLSNGGCHKIRI